MTIFYTSIFQILKVLTSRLRRIIILIKVTFFRKMKWSKVFTKMIFRLFLLIIHHSQQVSKNFFATVFYPIYESIEMVQYVKSKVVLDLFRQIVIIIIKECSISK